MKTIKERETQKKTNKQTNKQTKCEKNNEGPKLGES